MSVGFTDSIEGNIEILRELIGGLPPSERPNARKAAAMIEKAVIAVRKDCNSNVAAGIGMIFAMLNITQQLLQSDQEGEKSSLIQLLS